MARLIYVALAGALATLVVGFVVRTSNIPLLVSCAFSAVALVLMFRGWSKRLRESGGMFDEAEPDQQLEDLAPSDEAIPDDEFAPVMVETTTTLLEPLEHREAAEPYDIDAEGPLTRPMPRALAERQASGSPPAKPKAKPKPKPKAAAKPKPKPKPAPKAKAKAAPRPKAAPRVGAGEHVFVIPGREKYHADGCRFLKGDDVREVSEALAKRRGYVACGVCLK